MTEYALDKPLRGIIPPMVTPLADDDQIDTAGVGRLVEHLVQGGVHGLFILGTTGEGLSLSQPLRRELIDRVCELVNGRLPVLVGVTDTSLTESVALAKFAGAAGASCVVLAPPVYFPHEQSELLQCATEVADRSPVPVVLYNIPALTKIAFEPETVAKLTDVPNIIGIKDSSGDLDYFQAISNCTRHRSKWCVFTGHDLLLGQAVSNGAHGGVCGGANVFPRLFVDLYEAAVANNHARVADLQKSVMRLSELYRVRGNSTLDVIRGTKLALDELGICSARMVPPSRSLPETCRSEVRGIVSGIYEAVDSIPSS